MKPLVKVSQSYASSWIANKRSLHSVSTMPRFKREFKKRQQELKCMEHMVFHSTQEATAAPSPQTADNLQSLLELYSEGVLSVGLRGTGIEAFLVFYVRHH